MKNPQPPNIILLIMDSVGAKRCSAYGHPRPTTPGLARIAREGVLYRHCFAPAPWTLPSHVSLFSGLYPAQHGCINAEGEFPGNYYVLPAVLQQAGYRTLGLSSNLAISRRYNFHTGFDAFLEMETLFNTDGHQQLRQFIRSRMDSLKGNLDEVRLIFQAAFQNRYYSYPFKHLADRIYRQYWGNILKKSYHATERSVRIARHFMKENRSRPFFIFINFMECHVTYNPPPRFRNIFTAGGPEDSPLQLRYEEEIAYLDDRIFSLYAYLERLGLKDNTLFIATADHGEGFGEHGHHGHFFCIYNEQVHIPLVVKYPAALGLQGESTALVQLHDLFATLLEVAGVPLPAPESSRSLLGPPRDLALVENLDTSFLVRRLPDRARPPDYTQPCIGVIDNRLHKLIKWTNGRLELYDLNKDFGETVNLLRDPAYQDQAASLQAKLAQVSVPLPEGAAPWPPPD
jgi:arylsulfatase A-like enzyme